MRLGFTVEADYPIIVRVDEARGFFFFFSFALSGGADGVEMCEAAGISRQDSQRCSQLPTYVARYSQRKVSGHTSEKRLIIQSLCEFCLLPQDLDCQVPRWRLRRASAKSQPRRAGDRYRPWKKDHEENATKQSSVQSLRYMSHQCFLCQALRATRASHLRSFLIANFPRLVRSPLSILEDPGKERGTFSILNMKTLTIFALVFAILLGGDVAAGLGDLGPQELLAYSTTTGTSPSSIATLSTSTTTLQTIYTSTTSPAYDPVQMIIMNLAAEANKSTGIAQ